jgi:ATP-dependent DNA helicase RecG
MAPTELLAEQHYRNLSRVYSFLGQPVEVRLLTGSLRKTSGEAVRADIAHGTAEIVVGTHAIIQDEVEFQRLALVVVDEQHRFGVEQRESLRQKGFNPHVLVMTATPIPRSLALTLYGDMEVSLLDQMPPGRKQIKTYWVESGKRARAYDFIRSQVGEGRQAFIICPLIEESDKLETRAATAEHARLQTEVFPDLRLGLAHGRMRAADRDAVMTQFLRHDLDVLVSTSVVEVGIDVPNATVMMVEGADRFGLSQLHQFRGRVGRGENQSYCLLLADSPAEESLHRLEIIQSTQDGFKLAEEDLLMRGPGEFFGTRQSGLPDLKIARVSDMDTLLLAREEALRLVACDPGLRSPGHRLLRQQVDRLYNTSDGCCE